MSVPKVELRGQPFTMHPDMELGEGNKMYESSTCYVVSAPGFEDWTTGGREIVLIKRLSGWRAYVRETIAGYDTSFGRGGQTLHYRFHTIRSADTGKPLPFEHFVQDARARVQTLFLSGEPLPV